MSLAVRMSMSMSKSMSCLEKSLYFGQIQFVIWTNAFLILNIYIYTLDKYRPVLNTGQRNLCDWDDESGWVGTNTVCNLDKYSLLFGEMHF